MSRRIKIEALSDAVIKELHAYAKTTSEGMKKAVTKAGTAVRKEIQATAPIRSGAYKKSWSVKKTSESSNALKVKVYSRNRYQLAHLLEHGHAKRNGGRTQAKSHIAPAEDLGKKQLVTEIERMIRNG